MARVWRPSWWADARRDIVVTMTHHSAAHALNWCSHCCYTVRAAHGVWRLVRSVDGAENEEAGILGQSGIRRACSMLAAGVQQERGGNPEAMMRNRVRPMGSNGKGEATTLADRRADQVVRATALQHLEACCWHLDAPGCAGAGAPRGATAIVCMRSGPEAQVSINSARKAWRYLAT